GLTPMWSRIAQGPPAYLRPGRCPMRYHGDRKPAPNPAASHTRPRRILHVFAVRSTDDFDGAFAAAHTAQAEGFVILGRPLLNQNAPRLAALVAQHRLPAIHPNRRFVKAGGLMAYGPKESDSSWGSGAPRSL